MHRMAKEDFLSSTITGDWWGLAIRGVAAIVLGVLCFVLTGIALTLLVALFAAYLLVDGVFALVVGIRARSWLLGIEGVLGMLAGIVAALFPGITAVVLALIIATWAVVTGGLEIWAAVRLRRVIRNEWALIVGGMASLIFGVLMFIFPGAGLVTIVWIIGAYGIVFGILLLVAAFNVRARRDEVSRPATAA